MSQTHWGFEVRVPLERLVSWLSTMATRRGERFSAAVETTASPGDIEWQLSEGHTPLWSRAYSPICCYPEIVTALSRELETKVVTVSEQETSGVECFCVLEGGEIRTLFSRCDDGTEEEGVDRGWVDRYLASGLVRVPASLRPGDRDRYVYPAFVHVGCDVHMKWVWDAWEEFTPTHRMSAASLDQRFVGAQGRGWRANLRRVPLPR